ncbi:MAG: TonB C-terminal domain-containing protein [Candidatus Hydrogenedentota bacterium]
MLNYWGRLVRRQVERYWEIPGGIRLEEENRAVVSFWVDRSGNLLAEPEIESHAHDPAIAESGKRAIEHAAPFPPLPSDFEEPEQQVMFVFNLQR